MIVRMCGSCEEEREQLRARIAELEAQVERLKGGVEHPVGTRVRVLPVSDVDLVVGPGKVLGWEDMGDHIEYRVELENEFHDVVYVPGDELDSLE